MKKIFIYSQPPKEISNDIKNKIEKIEKLFGKNKALLNPPHITLSSGFKISEKDFVKFCKILKEEFDKLKKPMIKILGWEIYTEDEIYCIQLKIKNKKDIFNFYKKIEKLISKYEKLFVLDKFNPHISLAWNMKENMTKEAFDNAVNYLKKQKIFFDEEYVLDKLYIGEIHKSKFKVIKTIK